MIRLSLAVALLATVVGCNQRSSSPAVPGLSAEQAAALRSQLLVAVEPSAARTVIEVRDALAGASKDQTPDQVAVVGVVGGMPNPYGDEAQPDFPWVDGQAVFFLVDPTTAAQFEGHEHEKGEECSFCLSKARELVDTVAMVQLNREGKQVIPARADQLLDLKEGETIVVTGTAREELGMLMIDGSGVHVSPPSAEQPESNSAEEVEVDVEELEVDEQ